MRDVSSCETDSDDDDDVVIIPDSDDNRRRMLRETMDDDELENMRRFKREFLAKASPSKVATKGKAKETPDVPLRSDANTMTPRSGVNVPSFEVKSLVKEEMIHRRRESLGLDEVRKLGSRPNGDIPVRKSTPRVDLRVLPLTSTAQECGTELDSPEGKRWSCLVCTL